ncbi:MAG TPA: 6,7-dimethyl-8-ribityllumazine synthase [Acidimicrobiales bacterium]|jgi:6,7-dimethyl-8-ribityllumazine synthase|nr:6,7-dimethyl-8-ribityllumazine synthase [Acidimicrobiales bacterium]
MTSSDRTALPTDAKDRAARRVGTVIDGQSGTAGSGLRVGFACAEFNGAITDRLLTGALGVLEAAGGDLAHSVVAWAPGAFELPLVALRLAQSGSVDAVIALGAVIRGDTGHYQFVAGECAAGLQRVQLDTGVPVVFGVLTTDSVEQALVRSENDEENKGREAAVCALQMTAVLDGVAAASASPRLGFSVGGR